MRLASNSDRSSTVWISLVWYEYPQWICLKNYYTEMCNPAQTQWRIFVGSRMRVFFVVRTLQACSDRWWKGVPSGPLPGLLFILHVCFVHHDSMHERDILVEGIYSEKSNPLPTVCSQNLPSSWMIKNNTRRVVWFSWETSLLITRKSRLALTRKDAACGNQRTKSNEHNTYYTCTKLVLFPEKL